MMMRKRMGIVEVKLSGCKVVFMIAVGRDLSDK